MSEENNVETPQQEQSQQPIVNPEDANLAREKAAFETYVKDQGLQVPDNFQNTESWFNSLKEAQGQYTQARQEIADLKRQYADTGEIPNRPEQKQETAPAEETTSSGELRIEKKEEPPAPSMNEQWATWQQELALNGGFSEDTRGQIKAAMNVDDAVVDTFIAGQKALRKEAYDSAATVVGDQQTLDSVLTWAGESLNDQERDQLNLMLSGPSYKTALLGLKARYDQDMASRPKAQEPSRIRSDNIADAQEAPQMEPFRSRQEMNLAMSDPRYRSDPEYRQAVEQKVALTMNSGIFTR
tara:strand:+ start:71 stop:964 length:894 start_codon:yes stop_codon:yes gene_type:complete